jgi:transglutaminase-like putative cysteine protease
VHAAKARALDTLRTHVSRTLQHVRSGLQRMVRGPSEGWMTFVLLVLPVLLAVWIVGDAQWVATPGLFGLALCGATLGLVLAKIRFRPWWLFTTGALFGLVLSFYQLTSLAAGLTRLERLADVGTRLLAWWEALVSGGTSSETLAFSLFVLIISWLVGFVSSWFLFRKGSVWGALLPGGVAVVASLIDFSSRAQMFYLYLYLFSGVLLGARMFLLERRLDWERRGVEHLRPDSVVRLPDAFWLAVVIVLVTSLLPVQAGTAEPVAAAWYRISSPARAMGDEFARVLVGVQGREPDPGHVFGPTQPFEGGTTLREEPTLIVEAPFPIYLRARSYDVYTPAGWVTGETMLVSAAWTPERGVAADLQKLQALEVTIRDLAPLAAGDPLYLGGYPVYVSVDYQLEVTHPVRYDIPIDAGWLGSALAADRLPADLQTMARGLLDLINASDGQVRPVDVATLLPQDLTVVVSETTEGVSMVTLERHMPIPPDTISVRSVDGLAAGSSYRTAVYVSVATEGDLRAAGVEYPGWILDTYLQLPDALPSRVVELALELTSEAGSPYDKAVAIGDYLRTLEYSLAIETPPQGVDGVDHFLFDVQAGYCQYFASAMTVLLRACGVPSRMAVGFGPGEVVGPREPEDMIGVTPDEPQAGPLTCIVRDSHSWSEVFFPGYGWIQFEPTPVYPPIARGSPVLPIPGGRDGAVVPPGQTGPGPAEGKDARTVGAPYVRPLGIAAGLTLLGILVWLGWRRLFGPVSEPGVAYARIGYLATLSGLGASLSLTPYEYGCVLRGAMPEVSAEVDTVVDTNVRSHYGRRVLTGDDRLNIAEAWPRVRDGLLRRAVRGLLPRRFR